MNESDTGSTKTFFVKDDQKYGYRFDADKSTLYVVTKDASGAEVSSVLCTNVKKFKVQMLKSSVKIGKKEGSDKDSITGVNDVVQIKINIEIADGDITRTAARVTGVRNDMELGNIKLVGNKAEEFLTVEELVLYGFLVEE